MSASVQDAREKLASQSGVLGPGWRHVDAFEDLDDIDQYESDEEVGCLKEGMIR